MIRITSIVAALLFCFGCASTPGIEDHSIFLEKNSNTPGVVVTDSGLQFEVLREGTGPKPTESSKVTLHYIGKNIDGSEFDNSYNRGDPASFVLGGAIPAFVEGVQEMQAGSKYRFVVPSELAHGSKGAGRDIKSNSTLIFEIELLNFE